MAFRSVALGTLSATTASCLGLNETQCTDVAMAGVLHDICLYEDARQWLGKKQKLTDDLQLMQHHPLLGVELVAACDVVSATARVAMTQVHEQVDGSGYPRGLTADNCRRPARS